jgi:DNA polymerase
VLVTLGRFAMEYVVRQYAPAPKDAKISLVHGQVLDGQTAYGAVKIVPLFHPAVALYDESKREVLIEDFKVLKEVI